jgi:hypothetical protein
MPVPSPFALKLAAITEEQHNKFKFINEADPVLCKQIKAWTEDIGSVFESCTEVPWSAVFISWCVKQAGASKKDFKFANQHSVFVHQAIKNADAGTGVFHGFKFNAKVPAIGDIIQNNRLKNNFNFDFARKNADYSSHSVIVIETGVDAQGGFAFCVGGNESDSVRRSIVRLDDKGFIKQRPGNSFISIIKNLK